MPPINLDLTHSTHHVYCFRYTAMPAPHRHLSVDELSHRASTGLAIRRGDVKISEPIPSSYVHHGPEMDFANGQVVLINDDSGSCFGKNGLSASHGRSGSAPLSSHPAHVAKFAERASLGPSLSTSNMASVPANDSLSQKRDGGLRASIKRMFSKKSHVTTTQKREAHHSDPGRLLTTANSHNRPYFQSSSMQYTTVTPGHPLNSHATSPHLRVHTLDNVSQLSDIGQLGKRRNTLPGLSSDPQNEPEEVPPRQSDPPQEQTAAQRPGTATLQSAGSIQYLNRRSKSAGALSDLVLAPKSKPSSGRRDRSEEITFWRNSVVNTPLPQMPSLESMRSLNSSKDGRRPEDALSSKQPRPSIEPVQDFDFGLNNGSNAIRSTTLQERVNTLEVKLFDFEYALAKLQGNDLTKPALPKRPSRRRSTRSAIPESRGSSSSTNDTSYLSSPDEKWPSPVIRQTPHHKHDRTSKATTIKPVHTRRPSSRSQVSSPSIHITRSQYDALRTLVEDEKAARHKLEMQMMNLQQQVEALRTPIHAHIRPVQYPTPSPDSFRNHTQESPYQRTKRMPMPIFRPNKNPNETSRFSMSETDPDTEIDNDDRNYRGKGSPEIFETPQESIFRFEPRTISPSGMF